jgi:hypothetical protein
MPGTKTITNKLVLLLAPLASGQVPFPLEPGNQWVYRQGGPAGGRVFTVEAVKGDGEWTLLRGLPGGEIRVRASEDGKLLVRDGVWVDFGAREREPWLSAIDECSGRAWIESRRAKYEGALGTFAEALEVRYGPAGCADAGITSEVFLPWVGLVRRTMTTIAGPVSFDLVYARLGEATLLEYSAVGFGITVDRNPYYANLMPPVDPRQAVPVMTARLTLKNRQDQPFRITFSSGQTYDFVVRNEKGDEMYRWSEGKAFTLALRNVEVPRGELNWAELIPLGKDGKPWPQGSYVVEGWLATTGGKIYAASTAFELRHVF